MTTPAATGNGSAGVLVDIVGPPAPPPSPLVLAGWTVLAVLLAALLLVTFRRWWLGRRRRGYRRLSRLRRDLASGRRDPREVAGRVAALLRDMAQCPRLSTAAAPAWADPGQSANWQTFVARLNAARFAPEPPTPDIARELLAETGRWLRCLPR